MRELTASTQLLAVIGDPIAHSMSPKMHNAALTALDLDYVYVAYHVRPDQLQQAVDGFRALQIQGVNVTIPHKVAIMQYLDEIDPIAEQIGAINTIKNEDGHLIGKNTDGEGSIKALTDAGFDPNEKHAVMIGSGGAARAVAFFLAQSVKSLTIINRNEDFYIAKELATSLQKYNSIPITTIKLENQPEVARAIQTADLLLNTTPIGMHPHVDASPIDASLLHSNLFVFDIVYNPLKTKLQKDAEKIGCQTLSGIEMFVNQGLLAFQWWTGKTPDKALMREVVIQHLGLK